MSLPTFSETERQHTGEFILSEANGHRSRENVTVTVPTATRLQAGYVLAKLTATGKYVPYDNSGGDGSESAAGVLYAELDNTDGVAPVDFDAVAVVRDAEVRKGDLQWADGLVDADETAAYVDLAALGVIARD
jgi:hypothetical protein